MALAIFDLDHTLISGDSDYLWIQFLIEKKVISAAAYEETNQDFYTEYANGTLDIQAYLSFVLSLIKGIPLPELKIIRAEFIQKKIVPLIPQAARALVAKHKRQGDFTLIITATNRFVTEEIAKLLEVDDLIASEIEIVEDRITGRPLGTPSFQAGKVIRLREWLKAHPLLSLKGSFFYTDSHNDLPLLQRVTFPTVVNGDKILLEKARQEGWKCIELTA